MTFYDHQRHANIRCFFYRALNFFFALLVFVLALELSARLDDKIKYNAPMFEEYSADRLRGEDSDGVRRNLPNAGFEKWQHNSLGFRGPEVFQNKRHGTLRIVCMGTSETYGLYESPGKEWPSQLQSILPASKYEVINASVVGLGMASYEAYLKKYVFPLKPDILILVVSPLLYASSHERAANEEVKSVQNTPKVNPPKTSLKNKIIKNARVLPKIKQALKQLLTNNFPVMFKNYQLSNMQKQVKEIEINRLKDKKPIDVVSDIHINSFRNEMKGLIDSIRTQGIEVVLTSSPALISQENIASYPDIFMDNRRFSIELSFTGMIDAIQKYNAAIAEVAREDKLLFADSATRIPNKIEYFGDNVHFTDKGARLFAEAVAAQITDNKH